MLQTPLVSVILVSWNSKAHLSECLSRLAGQTLADVDYEIILVDNGSTDGALDKIENHWPALTLTVERLERNFGFAFANNMGARLAKGKWIALLNTDAFPEPDWLEQLMDAWQKNPEYSMFASRQIQYYLPELLDGAGDVYHVSGIAWRNYYNYPANRYALAQIETFSPCAAASLYSREEFLKAGGFDNDYFSYFEDVDLGFRLRLGGAKCLYVPEAIVHHVGSSSTGKRSDFSVYYGYRNMIWTFFKDMPHPFLLMFLPLHILTLIFFFVYLSLRGQHQAIFSAIKDALSGMPQVFSKRKYIQKQIKINRLGLIRTMSIGLIEPYREFANRNKVK